MRSLITMNTDRTLRLLKVMSRKNVYVAFAMDKFEKGELSYEDLIIECFKGMEACKDMLENDLLRLQQKTTPWRL